MMRVVWLAGVLLISLPGVAAAGPIDYDESVLGDINGTSLGNLDVGTNTIAGSVTAGAVTDADLFTVALPDGLRIDSVSLGTAAGGFGLPIAAAVAGSSIVTVWSGTNNVYGFPVPIEPLQFEVQGFQGGLATFGVGYRWTISVSPVPEPASLVLFGLGLGGLAGYGLRRRRG